MEFGNKAIYDGQFHGNKLVVGKAACGKIYFLQKVKLNIFFGELFKTKWVTGIGTDEQKEAEIQSCFSNEVEFHLATEPDDLVSLIEKFKLRTRDITNNDGNSGFRENISMDCLIVMDDVLSIAENCKKFAEILTVCRKYRYHYICVFHIIMPENQTWKKILSQPNIFNIFLSSVPHNTVAKILQSNCRQTTKKYVPARSMWVNTFFSDLANTDEWHCLTVDCSGVKKKNGPGRYRTQADDPEKQVCYFNKPWDDELYNVFISNRIKTENFSNIIYFKIDPVQNKDETFDAGKILKQDGGHDRFSKFYIAPEPEFNRRGTVRKREYEETFEHSNGRTRKSAWILILFLPIRGITKVI